MAESGMHTVHRLAPLARPWRGEKVRFVRESRYDPVADWYVEFTRGWEDGDSPHAVLPAELLGQRVLDLACGYGTQSRWLARRGAVVTAVDLSARLLAEAQGREQEQSLGIRYLRGDAASIDWWDGSLFDGVICHMALMDIDDLSGTYRVARTVLRPGGWFTFSVFHPCHPGSPERLSAWPPDLGYDAETYWSTEEQGVRGHVGAHHRMISTYINEALRAGFLLNEVSEQAHDGLPFFLSAGFTAN